MNNTQICHDDICGFLEHLRREEKSEATQEKYVRDVLAFSAFAGEKSVSKELLMEYKKDRIERGYAPRSVNSMLSSINSFLEYKGWSAFKVKNLRIQRQIFCAEEKELTKAEYFRLLKATKKNEQLYLILQTICGTGIRVSELRHFTVESVTKGQVVVTCKGKTRTILVPGKLKKHLLAFARKREIATGAIFVGKKGTALDRSVIWRKMKELCQEAGVATSKVFPHNLRKLFARTFYEIEKDIAKLADILGHASVNTTRIYIMTTEAEHRTKIEHLGLVI